MTTMIPLLGSIVYSPTQTSVVRRLTDRPHIGGNGGDIGVGQRRSAFWRHRHFVVVRPRHPVGDYFLDRWEAAVTHEVLAVHQRRRLRPAARIGAVAAAAGAARGLAKID